MKMSKKINNGKASPIWHGITSQHLVRRCESATQQEALAMSNAASLMLAGECTETEFAAAEAALNAVERRLVNDYTGVVKLNRFGRPFGGIHPALV